MGIRGLMNYCLHRDEVINYQDLVAESSRLGGFELFVDFYSFCQFVTENVHQILTNQGHNRYCHESGGEYQYYDDYITVFVNSLRSIGIDLVFFVDAPRGSEKETWDEKFTTWKYRFEEEIQVLKLLKKENWSSKLLKECRNKFRPHLRDLQVQLSLESLNVEVKYCSAGEADLHICKEFSIRPRAYAILSNDSDFFIYKASVCIPWNLFDVRKDFQQNEGSFPKSPKRLIVGTIRPETLIKYWRLRDHDQLVDVAILCGNDLTLSLVTPKVPEYLDVPPGRIEAVVARIRQGLTIEISRFAEDMERDEKMRKTIEHSRAMYALLLDPRLTYKGPFTIVLEELVKAGRLAPNLLAMHFNVFWRKSVLQECSSDVPFVEDAILDLRRKLYSMILNDSSEHVVEYGRVRSEELRSIRVTCSGDIPRLDVLFAWSKDDKMKLFLQLFACHETDDDQSEDCGQSHAHLHIYRQHGNVAAFLYSLIRYLVHVGRQSSPPLLITCGEFLAICCAMLAHPKESPLRQLEIKPSMRCLTITAWLQHCYLYMYNYIGMALDLSREFPTPAAIFSGLVLVPMLVNASAEGHVALPPIYQLTIESEMNATIKKHSVLLASIATGLYLPDELKLNRNAPRSSLRHS